MPLSFSTIYMENKNRITFKWLLLVIFFGLGFNNLLAQTKVVSGTVTDAAGVALPGVSVMVKDSKKGVSTDFDGNFKIDIHEGEVLVFSYVGMETLHHKVTAKDKTLNIVLKEAVNELEDMVVVGYGTAKKITAITGSVAKVSGENLMNKPSASVLDALQGKVAGLSIFSSSGEPSDIATIRLHGSGSIFGRTDPLFVLDGSPVSKQVAILLNPSDIESVTILKDASATSIYGTRASNGVIYITTRRGKGNEEATVTINSQYGFSNLAGREFFNRMMSVEEYAYSLVEFNGFTQDQAEEIIRNNPNPTRWDEVFFKDNVPMLQLNASVSGGGRKTRYYLSGGYYNQEGLMYRSGFERYTLRTNLDTEINHWLKTSFRLSAGYSEFMVNGNAGAASSYEGSLSVLTPPIYPATDENGKRYNWIPGLGALPHPHYAAENNPATSGNVNITPQLSVTVNPIKGLYIKLEGGLQYMNTRYIAYSVPSFVEEYNSFLFPFEPKKKNYASKNVNEILMKTLTNTIEYQFDLGQMHNFTILAGQESLITDFSSLNTRSEGQVSDRAIMLRHGNENKEVLDSRSTNTFNSFFGRIDYSFDNKYFADLSVRRDGSSRFGKNNQYADFWAVGLMWKIDNEKFFKDTKWLDVLDVKFSIGTSGNADVIPEYGSLQRIGNSQFYKDRTAYSIDNPGNPDLEWQKQLKASFGIDIGVLRAVNLSLDLYDRRTTNMLSSLYVPSFSGYIGIIANGGELQNKGVDLYLSVNVFNKAKHKFDFTPFVAFNYNQEKIISLYDGKTSIIGDETPIAFIVGHPLVYYYPIFQQINPDTGDAQWYVPGADPTIRTTDDNTITTTFDGENLRQNTNVKRNPPINGGFGFSASYKNISIQTMFAYSLGKYMINEDRLRTENPIITGFPFESDNQNRTVLDYWKNPGDRTQFPRKVSGRNFTEPDSRLIEDASYIRMKDISISYSLPEETLKRVGFFKGIRVFASGRNLLTFTKYTGLDPEFDIPVKGNNPSTKQYTFGIEVRF